MLAFALLCLAPFAMGLLAIALGQDANWDLRNYHYYNAYAFLTDRYAQDLLPAQTPSFYNPTLDLPFFWLATHVPARIAGFALGFVQGLNLCLLFIIAHTVLIVPNPRHKVFVCAGLATLGMLGGGGIAQIGTTFGDNIVSLGVLLSAALIARHHERLVLDNIDRMFGLALLFGIPCGAMVGLKLPTVIYAVGLCGGMLFIGGRIGRRLALAFAFGVGILVGITLTLGHWAIFLQNHYGSPLFPYFNNFFQAPLAPLTSARDTQFIPRSLHDALLMPFIFADSPFRVGEIPWRDWRIPVLYAVLPLALILRLCFGRNRAAHDGLAHATASRYLLASFALSYVVWLIMFTVYRYAVTLEMVAPLMLVCAIGWLPLKLSTRGLLAAVLLAVVSASIQPGNWSRRDAWSDRFVDTTIPDLGDTSNLMILMAGFEPYAHVIPNFPANIAFVRIQSNFASPDQDKGINAVLHKRVDAHRANHGRLMMLIPDWQLAMADDALSYYNLHLVRPSCQTVIDHLYHDAQLSLCPVIPLTHPSPLNEKKS